MRVTFLVIGIMLFLSSCIKKQYGCVINRTGLFEVNNESGVTAKFVLIQKSDTIRETILPWTNYQYTIKAGVITKSYVYIADTIYNKTMDNWKIKRCQLDGHLIRFK
jgi:hypothetical protein